MTTRVRTPTGVGILCLIAFYTVSVHGAAAADPRPHRALYDVSFSGLPGISELPAELVDVVQRGELELKWADACEDWIMSENMSIRMDARARVDTDHLDAFFEIVASYVSYETKSGDLFRFSFRVSEKSRMTTEDGEAHEEEYKEEYVGYAKPGQVVFAVPNGKSIPLPEGTVFPIEHMLLLIDAAASGRSLLKRTVFDGAGLDGLNEVVSSIGAEIPAGTPLAANGGDRAALRSLADLRSWPVSEAYFPLDSDADSDALDPDYEAAFRLFENGVTAALVFKFDDGVTMNAELTEIEFFPPPTC